MTAKDDTRILTNSNLCKITYDAVIQACDGEHFPMSLVRNEAQAVYLAVNIGIDSRLQICNCPERGDSFDIEQRKIKAGPNMKHFVEGDDIVLANTLSCSVSPESLCVLIRRLVDDGPYCEDEACDGDCIGCAGPSLAEGILQVLGFDDCGRFVGRDD